tara:strand:- start:387 stop:743 length:357 start_codon:yes stop_codon:yes gene_type:complete
MSKWRELASTHSLQALCEMAVRSIELQAQVRKLQAELSEQAHCDEPSIGNTYGGRKGCDSDIPWEPSVGEECLIVFGGTKCKVLALHQGQAAVSTGGQLIAVDAAQLTQAKGVDSAKS